MGVTTETTSAVPRRFELAIASHIVANVADIDPNAPLLLGIHGPSGEGKTKQCELTCASMGITVTLISGGELEHRQAGRPGELIRDRYLEAAKTIDPSEGRFAVLLINDIDTGLGVWSNRSRAIFQYTVNLQNVYATLMNIADKPTLVDGQSCHRVPIIITGNDFSVLHEPLLRDGRMTKLYWKPSVEERLEIAQRILSDLNLDSDALGRFLDEYKQEPVAFFAHIRSLWFQAQATAWIETRRLSDVVSGAASGELARWMRGVADVDAFALLQRVTADAAAEKRIVQQALSGN